MLFQKTHVLQVTAVKRSITKSHPPVPSPGHGNQPGNELAEKQAARLYTAKDQPDTAAGTAARRGLIKGANLMLQSNIHG